MTTPKSCPYCRIPINSHSAEQARMCLRALGLEKEEQKERRPA